MKIITFMGAFVVVLILIQFIPIQHDDPAATREIQWNSPQTRELAKRACFDCHSNETVWPWYAHIAPMSLGVANHVYDGRRRLNFSQWDGPNANTNEIIEQTSSGRMPLWDYLLLHPEAKLTNTEKQALIDGLKQTLANDPPIARQRRRQSQ